MSDISKRILACMQEQNISYGELAGETQIPKSALQRYATGETEKVPLDRLEKIAEALHVQTAWLLGWEIESPTAPFQPLSKKTIPLGFEAVPETQAVPLVGNIACGEPILAEENIEMFVDAPKGRGIDFCLTCRGGQYVGLGHP